jgi:hypothetical protein
VRLTPWKVPPAKPHHAATDVDREDDTAPGKPQPRHQKGLAFQRAIRRQPGSSEEIAKALGMSVVSFVSRHSIYFANVQRRDLPSLRYHARLSTARKVELCKRRFRTLMKVPYHPLTRTGRPPSLVPAETSRVSALPARRPRRGSARADPSCARCFAEDCTRAYMYSARLKRTP